MEIVIGAIIVIGIIWLIFHPGFIFDVIGSIFSAIFNIIGSCVGCLVGGAIFLVFVYFVIQYLIGAV